MRRPVTIAKYLDATEAQLAKVRLGGEGIEAFVIEGAGFNPLLAAATGGVQLQVRERDIDRARAILAEVQPDVEDEADLAPGGDRVVRCPRCELEYCYHERARVTGESLALSILEKVWFTALSVIAIRSSEAPKRWRCRKCEHVWDDANEGPARMTRLEPGDPRPVFRLRRGRGGTGLFLGLMLGFVSAMMVSGAMGHPTGDVALNMPYFLGMLMLGGPLVGWWIGKSVLTDVCSLPTCRTPLPRELEECPGCKGTIAGTITSAPEHFSAAADVRRELAASRQAELPRKKTKKKKPIEPAAPAP